MRYDWLAAALASVLSVACDQQPVNGAPVVARVDSKMQTKMEYDDEGALAAVNLTITLAVVATDPDRDPLTYDWRATSGVLKPAGAGAVWTGAKIGDTVTVTVHDGKGGADEHNWEYIKAKS